MKLLCLSETSSRPPLKLLDPRGRTQEGSLIEPSLSPQTDGGGEGRGRRGEGRESMKECNPVPVLKDPNERVIVCVSRYKETVREPCIRVAQHVHVSVLSHSQVPLRRFILRALLSSFE